jgi:hypothetical protein
MRFRKGDFMYIPTVGTYRCICADNEVAVFSEPEAVGNYNTFTRRQKDGKVVKGMKFEETDMIQYHEDIAYYK